jgi:hypothetical protein
MFLIGPYLFSGEILEDYLAARRAEALKAVADIKDTELAARGREAVITDLHRRYSIPVTDMHVDQAHFSGERPMTLEECQSIGARAEDADKFKAITISIPYSGDAHLFTCTPTIYSANQPQADVRDGALHVTYFLSEPEEMQLENNFKRLIALIERTLEVTQWQAMTHNELLMGALTEAFDARVA